MVAGGGIGPSLYTKTFLAISPLQADSKHNLVGVVAQLVERLVRNEEVRGSTPLGSTSLRLERSGRRMKFFTP